MNPNRKILIVDDSPSIREDFQKILCPRQSPDLSRTEMLLFGDESGSYLIPDSLTPGQEEYELEFASQAQEAYTKITKAYERDEPYAFIFTDVIMPPGIDGVQLVKKIWQTYPETEIVMVTAHSDYSWADIVRELGASSRLLIIKKPFDHITIKQVALTLTQKISAEQQLKQHRDNLREEVARRTTALLESNLELERKSELLERINLHYRTLFQPKEVSIWYEDMSEIRSFLDDLREQGIEDLDGYLRERPKVIQKLAASIRVHEVDEETQRMFRVDREAFPLESPSTWIEDSDLLIRELVAIWSGEKVFRTESMRKKADGQEQFFILTMSIPRMNDDYHRIPVSVRNITEQKRAEQVLQHFAYYDDLTKLPNKKLFYDRLEFALQEAKRKIFNRNGKASVLGLLFLDLDGFKTVNDTQGHLLGDQLLKEVGRRLKACVKRGSDTVARLSGDEFGVILPNLGRSYHAQSIGKNILHELNQPFQFNVDGRQKTITISCSIGVALFPADAEDPEGLVERADTAMFKAKSAGKNRLRFFTPAMEGEVKKRINLEKSLERALENDELKIHYQPIFEKETGAMYAVEALLRWGDAGVGAIGPADFIPMAEESGLILHLDRWILNAAMRQLALWRKTSLPPFLMQINLSVRQIREVGFARRLADLFAGSSVDPGSLVLEIDERVFGEERSGKVDLAAFKEIGVKLALDHFGTGNSSATDLRNAPVDFVKLDRSLVLDPKSWDMAKGLVLLSRTLGKMAVGVGAQTKDRAQFLKDCGCGLIQGFFYSKPLPADELETFLRQYEGTRASV